MRITRLSGPDYVRMRPHYLRTAREYRPETTMIENDDSGSKQASAALRSFPVEKALDVQVQSAEALPLSEFNLRSVESIARRAPWPLWEHSRVLPSLPRHRTAFLALGASLRHRLSADQ